MARATFGKKLKVFANAGVFGAYAVEAYQSGATGDPYMQFKQNILPYYRRLDMGVVGGVGVIVPIKNKLKASFEVRNSLGLYNRHKTPILDGTDKSNSTAVLVGLSYVIK
jgi:hypothetical protein